MRPKKMKLLVLFGGISSEHNVSRQSAASLLEHIDKEKYEIHVIGITKRGRWYLTAASPKEINDGSWEKRNDNGETVICPDPEVHGIKKLEGESIQINCAVPILHGKNGEDGAMQGLLEISGIPYVGSDVISSACAMDKVVTKYFVERTDINQAKYYDTNKYNFEKDSDKEIKEIEKNFDGQYPLFVKPASAGSSVGVSKVKNREELVTGIKIALEESHKVLVEEAIVGRELEVGILGNRNPKASPIGEIIAGDEFYSYEAKYANDQTKTGVVTDLTDDKVREIQAAAIKVYEAVGCSGLSRVDFFLTKKGKVVFNEINNLPGFTEISMYPQLWKAAGIEYPDLIDKIIELAMG